MQTGRKQFSPRPHIKTAQSFPQFLNFICDSRRFGQISSFIKAGLFWKLAVSGD
jgi:hypothetical protein